MKEWFKNHYRVLIALALFLVTYLLLCSICSDYIEFEESRRTYRALVEFNLKVAKFYFLQLPFGASVPSLLYILSDYLEPKSNH